MPTIDEQLARIIDLEKAGLSCASQVECSPDFTYCSPEFVKFCEASIEFAPKAARALKIALPILNICSVASCTCRTKTPDIAYHTEDCRYRRIEEALHAITKELES